eukprot:5472429-Pyramimonas_sp.AAC.1
MPGEDATGDPGCASAGRARGCAAEALGALARAWPAEAEAAPLVAPLQQMLEAAPALHRSLAGSETKPLWLTGSLGHVRRCPRLCFVRR